jgi:hypothetical protein
MEGVKILPEAVKPGAFKEHMEGLRRGAAPAEEKKDDAKK